MHLIHTTRKYFIFNTGHDQDFYNSGVRGFDDLIWIPRCYPGTDNKAYKQINRENENLITCETETDCQKWYDEFKAEEKELKKVTKKLYNVKSTSVKEITDGDWELIKSFMVNPANIERETVAT